MSGSRPEHSAWVFGSQAHSRRARNDRRAGILDAERRGDVRGDLGAARRVLGIACVVLAVGVAALGVHLSSTSSDLVRVPSVLGQTRAAAWSELRTLKLKVVVVRSHGGPAKPPPLGTVIAETPLPGAEIARGSSVHLTVFVP